MKKSSLLAILSTLLCQCVMANGAALALELVVPTASQGSTDQIAHLLAAGLSTRGFGEVKVVNMPGRSGTLAAKYVANSAPNGRTLLITTPSSHGIASSFENNLSYNPVTSFTPIIRFAAAPYILVVNMAGPTNLGQFLQQARNTNGQWRYSSTGIGGPHHLIAEFYFKSSGLNLIHQPASGGANAIGKVQNGSVEVMLPTAILALPKIQAQQLRALAVSGDKRITSLPEVPTFGELGVPIQFESWYGLMGPSGLPIEKVQQLSTAVIAILNEPAVEEKLVKLAINKKAERDDDFRQVITNEILLWKNLVLTLGLSIEKNNLNK